MSASFLFAARLFDLTVNVGFCLTFNELSFYAHPIRASFLGSIRMAYKPYEQSAKLDEVDGTKENWLGFR